MLFTGGIDKSDPTNEKDNPDDAIMLFFRDYFAKFITKTWVKVTVILVFLAYLGVSAYGITTMEEGLRLERLYSEDSYLHQFYVNQNKYFRAYPYRVQVNFKLNYQ
jgi:hypothetical protein